MIHWPDILLAALVATLVWLIVCRPWPHEQQRLGVHGRMASEVGAGGSSARGDSVATDPRRGLTATAGVDTCTCDPEFYPDAVDADCPWHGVVAFSRTRIFDQEREYAHLDRLIDEVRA